MKRVAFPLILAMLAGACARSEDATVQPVDGNGTAVAEQVPQSSEQEQEPALGEWRQALQDAVPALEFGPSGTSPVLSLVCGTRGGLVLQRHGVVASGNEPTIAIAIGGQTRQLPVTAVAGTAPMLRAQIAGGDTLISQMASAPTPISLRSGDGTPLIVPSSPLIGQFASACNGTPATAGAAGAAPAAGAAAAEGNAVQTNEAAPAPAPATNTAAPAR